MLLKTLSFAALAGAVALIVTAAASRSAADETPDPKRGEYLVVAAGCNDCHTPWKLGPNGPEPDMTRMLSGHPAEMLMPPAPELPAGPWLVTVGATFTAWNGPWGTSFTANLTPDAETGTGKWTADDFIATLRNGRHLGRGRELLPPMPYQNIAQLSDTDLRHVFAYLQSIPAISNRVPQPIAPPAQR